jgi:hypothetical protein
MPGCRLVTDSEERQRRELALRTAQVMRDGEIQRKVDMATVAEHRPDTGHDWRRAAEAAS